MSTATAEFLQRFASHINDSPACDALLPALLQVREKCLSTIRDGTSTDVKPDRNLGCRWCLNSWSLGQYTVRLIPQKRPKGFRGLRAKLLSNPEQFAKGKKKRSYIGHNFLSLKCDVCFGITKIPILKPMEEPKPETPLPSSPPKKKKKGKKRDEFAGLNPAAVKAVKQKTPALDCQTKVLNVFEVLSPSSIQNGVNIVSNRTTKSRSQPSASTPDKPSLIKSIATPTPSPKTSSSSKNKKKKVKNSGHVEKPKKTKNVTSALASFLNSL